MFTICPSNNTPLSEFWSRDRLGYKLMRLLQIGEEAAID
jgi:hypothetical protein